MQQLGAWNALIWHLQGCNFQYLPSLTIFTVCIFSVFSYSSWKSINSWQGLGYPRLCVVSFSSISSTGLSTSKTTNTWLHRTQQFCISLISYRHSIKHSWCRSIAFIGMPGLGTLNHTETKQLSTPSPLQSCKCNCRSLFSTTSLVEMCPSVPWKCSFISSGQMCPRNQLKIQRWTIKHPGCL